MKYLKQLIVIPGFAFLLTACNNMTADDYVKQAKSHVTAGKSQDAVIALKNAIAEDSRHVEARLLLAKAYLDVGEGLNAVKELTRAKTLRANQSVLAGPMVEALFMAQDYQATVDYIDELLPNVRAQQPEKFSLYQAWAFTEMGNLVTAKEVLTAARWDKQSEYSTTADLLKAFIEEDSNSLQEITQIIISHDTMFDDSLWLVGKINYVQGRYPDASLALEKYAVAKPKFTPVVFLLAKSLMQSNETEQAQQYVDQLLQKTPDEPVSNLLAATLAFQQKNYDSAFKYAEKTIQISGNNPQSQLIAGMSSYYTRKYEEAFYYLEPVEPYLSEGHAAKRAYLATLIVLNKTGKVFELLSQDSMQDADARALLDSTSVQLIEQGEFEKSKLLQAKSASLNNEQDTGYFSGIAQLLQGDSKGLDILLALSEAEPDNQIVKLSIVSAYINQKQLTKASELLETVQGNEQIERVKLTLAAKVSLGNNDVEAAESDYRKLLAISATDRDANLYFARKALTENSPETALEHINNVLIEEPANINALMFAVAAHQQLGSIDNALILLEKAKSESETDYAAQLLYAETLYRAEQYDKAMAELGAMFANHKDHSNRFWQLYGVATKKLRPNDYLEVLLQWNSAEPTNPESLYRLGEYYLATRDFDRAKNYLNSGLSVDSADPALNLLEADWLVETKQTDKARIKLVGLKVPDEYGPAKSGIEGKLDYYSRDYESAQPKVLRFYSHTPTVQYALLLRAIYIRLEQPEKSVAVLEQHLKAFPADNIVRLTLANQMMRLDRERAVTLFKQALEYAPESEVALKALTNLYQNQGELDQALEYSDKWLAINDKNPAALNSNGKLLLSKEPNRLAVKRLMLAHEAMPSNLTFTLDYAEGLIKSGETQAGLTLLEEIKHPLPAFRKRVEELKKLAADSE